MASCATCEVLGPAESFCQAPSFDGLWPRDSIRLRIGATFDEATKKKEPKMKLSELKVGHWYKLDYDAFEYLGEYEGNFYARYKNAANIWRISESYDYSECHPDGTPIAPVPAPGQVWMGGSQGNEFVINEVLMPNGRKRFGAINQYGRFWDNPKPSPSEAVEDLTYVRTLPNM